MARPVSCPHGAWPLEMRAETAAAFADEPSVDAFLAKVDRGLYPSPRRQPGCLPKWHRGKLEHAIAHLHGLVSAGPQLVESLEDLI